VAQIKTIPQVEAALGFFALVGSDSYDVAELETKCGVGMEIACSNSSKRVILMLRSGSQFVVVKSTRRQMFMPIGYSLLSWYLHGPLYSGGICFFNSEKFCVFWFSVLYLESLSFYAVILLQVWKFLRPRSKRLCHLLLT